MVEVVILSLWFALSTAKGLLFSHHEVFATLRFELNWQV
jgi:hypothetical protein